MNISKVALLEAIDNAVARQEERRVAYIEAKARMGVRSDERWFAESLPKFVALRDALTKAIRAKTTITRSTWEEAFGTDRYGSSASPPWYSEFSDSSFTLNGKQYNNEVSQSARLESLRGFLLAVEDDVVTPAALKSMGFKDLNWLFRAALDIR